MWKCNDDDWGPKVPGRGTVWASKLKVDSNIPTMIIMSHFIARADNDNSDDVDDNR